MLDITTEYPICRNDDDLETLCQEHGSDCTEYVDEDEKGNSIEEPLCGVDNEPCKVGKVRLCWVGEPIFKEA